MPEFVIQILGIILGIAFWDFCKFIYATAKRKKGKKVSDI